ncbi:MAG: Crp/Fnr family transcriptional regulator [Pseudomonadota bacterium]
MTLPQAFARTFGGHRLTLQSGEYAFCQDDPTTGLFSVVSGYVELRRVTKDGTSVVLHHAGPGETFAEASLFSQTYHCDAVAQTACELVQFKKADVLSQLQTHNETSLAFIEHLSGQVQRYRLLLQLCAIRRADDRVLAAMRAGFQPESWKSFAPQIGLTHEAVYRALSALTKRGLIVRKDRGVYALI